MKKRIISFIVTAVLVLSCSGTVAFAAEPELETMLVEDSIVENQSILPNEMVIIDFGKDDSSIIQIFDKDEQEVLFTLEKVDEMVYSTEYLNVRQRPTTQSKVHTVVAPGFEFHRIGHSDFGWDLMADGEEFFFLWNEYLTTEEPEQIIQASILTENYNPHSPRLYEPGEFKYMGVIHWNGYRWTYYSERILPGPGLNIPGRHTDAEGYVRDENNYICLASSDLPKGTIVPTPFGGDGKIYDCGCASGTLDVYTNW